MLCMCFDAFDLHINSELRVIYLLLENENVYLLGIFFAKMVKIYRSCFHFLCSKEFFGDN